MPDKTIVILLQDGSDSYGEVKEFDQPRDAERHIEALLEVGFERPSIRVLEAHDLNLAVTQKAVVSLFATPPSAVAPPIVEESAETIAAPAKGNKGTDAVMEMAAPEYREEPEALPAGDGAELYHRNGIRFSSAFSSER